MQQSTDTNSIRRRLSFASNVQSRMDVWNDSFGRQQQVIAIQLFFDDEAPTLMQMRGLADLLGQRLHRLRGIPTDVPGDTKERRIFEDVADWPAALDVIVQDSPLKNDTKTEARIFLEQVKLKDINPVENGVQVPLWRLYRVGSRSVVLTIDHTIGDGLSVISIFAIVSSASPHSGKPMALEQVSPLFEVISKATWWQKLLRKWAFLWPPNFIRCIRILKNFVTFPLNPITPLMPTDMGETIKSKTFQRIPANCYGTIYLCPLPVSLFKSLARADGKLMTVNDVLAAAIGETVRRYVKEVGYHGEGPIQFLTPIAVPKELSDFLDEWEGLNNQYVVLGHSLPLLGAKEASTSSFREMLHSMHSSFQEIKTSGITALMFMLLSIIGRFFAKPSGMREQMQDGIGKVSYVWSNMIGPSMPMYIQDKKVSELHCLVSHPFCMMTTTSYNGMVYTNIQVDTRTSLESAKLAEAYRVTIQVAIAELLAGPEQENALRTLNEAALRHQPGPFLSPMDV